MSQQLEDISLVKQVEYYPCLWNYSSSSYCRTDLVALAWKNIAKKLNTSEEYCRDRWKNIRTAFRRSLQPSKSGTRRSKKPYYLTNYLSFLVPYLKGARISRNLTSKNAIYEENDDEPKNSSNAQYSNIKKELDDTNDSYIISEANASDSCIELENVMDSNPKKKIKKETNLTEDVDKTFVDWFEIEEEKNAKKEEDSDYLFFRFMLCDFKKLSEKRKRNLKCQFMQLINKQLEQTEMEAFDNSVSTNDNSR